MTRNVMILVSCAFLNILMTWISRYRKQLPVSKSRSLEIRYPMAHQCQKTFGIITGKTCRYETSGGLSIPLATHMN